MAGMQRTRRGSMEAWRQSGHGPPATALTTLGTEMLPPISASSIVVAAPRASHQCALLTLIRKVRRLSSMAPRGSSDLVARPVVKTALARVGRMDASRNLLSAPVWGVESGAGGALAQLSATSRVGALRFMGFGTFNEEHPNAAVPEGNEDEVKADEHPEETIEKASQELFRQSNVIGDSEDSEVEEFQVKELGREKPGADIAREVWSAKEQDGTSVFSDQSDRVQSEA